MKLLLDTHTFLWLDMQPQALSAAALAACESPYNELYLSLVSAWEIQIKTQLNKLSLRVPLDQMIEVQQADNGLHILPITLPHIREFSAAADGGFRLEPYPCFRAWLDRVAEQRGHTPVARPPLLS